MNDHPVRIRYRNYRGETAWRRVIPIRLFFTATPWHGEAQWVMDAIDLDKDEMRSFAMKDVLAWESAP